ncbi:MAG TPA: hypothetical protein VMT46_16820 [Anaerolineaceae bacterium]|nr:hypothetical protein [Anaerolineaceae bacterium]
MKTYRTNAILIGALYILGTVSGVLSMIVTTPLLDPAGAGRRSSPLRRDGTETGQPRPQREPRVAHLGGRPRA